MQNENIHKTPRNLKSCVALDLDSTIVNMFGTLSNWNFVDFDENARLKNKIIDIKTNRTFMWGTKRSGVEEFLKSCFENFDVVGVWSAGSYDYVYQIVDTIFPKRPDFIWTRQDCVSTMHYNEISKKYEPVIQKPLEKIHMKFPEIDPKRTIIVDDYLDVCGQNTLYHVHVSAWTGSFDSMMNSDLVLVNLAKWFSELKSYDDFKFASPKI